VVFKNANADYPATDINC